MYYSAEIAVDHITDHLPFRSTRKQWTGERRRARFSERKGAEKAIFGGKRHHKCVWEQDAAGSNPVIPTSFFYTYGSIAQLGEHLPYKQRVIGSSPIVPTKTSAAAGVFLRLV